MLKCYSLYNSNKEVMIIIIQLIVNKVNLTTFKHINHNQTQKLQFIPQTPTKLICAKIYRISDNAKFSSTNEY